MTSMKLSYLSIPLFALALTTYVATTAVAEESMSAKPVAESGKEAGKHGKGEHHKGGKRGGGGMMMTAEELGKLEGLSAEDRKSYFKQRRADFEKLSKEEKEAKMAERKKAFDALSDADKKALKERNEKFHDTIKAEKKKEMEDFLSTLTPEQRAKWDAMQKDKHHRWGGKDGKRGDKGPKDHDGGDPAPSDKAE